MISTWIYLFKSEIPIAIQRNPVAAMRGCNKDTAVPSVYAVAVSVRATPVVSDAEYQVL